MTLLVKHQKKIESHPSILETKRSVTAEPFSFHTVTLQDVEHEIRILNQNKATMPVTVYLLEI